MNRTLNADAIPPHTAPNPDHIPECGIGAGTLKAGQGAAVLAVNALLDAAADADQESAAQAAIEADKQAG